ncbi:hypothetical protein KUTeg_011756 [Tegillarca granosa]|uniref:Uncharacterized protein n=1 Tax=Tegillarca granosa TaxID=220873 RepID=A0ABQ9EXJ9_TEGGR|nr:hypothetical protein KUTeg_011756 [Tegillarca granosa]
MQVHIRQFELGVKGPFPTSKAVALNLEKWKKLEEIYVDDIGLIVTNFDENVDCKINLETNRQLKYTPVVPVPGFGCNGAHKERDFLDLYTVVIPKEFNGSG